MSRLPEPAGEKGGPLVPRRLTNEEFEVVIRRAAELQARAAESGEEGLTEAEAIRIGKELGLSGAYLSQALAEVRGREGGEPGLMDRMMGPGVLRASRVVAGEADVVRRRLESYLCDHEYYSVLRRLPDRVIFEPASGAFAAVGRAASRAFSRSSIMRVDNLEVSVQPLEDGFSHVSLLTRLSTERAGYLAGGVLSGGAMGGMAAAALGVAVDPAAALLGLPIFGGSVWGVRWAYLYSLQRTQTQLEALLDRLEHGELPASPPAWQRRRG